MNTRFKETGKKLGIWLVIAAIFFVSFPFRLQAAEETQAAETVVTEEPAAENPTTDEPTTDDPTPEEPSDPEPVNPHTKDGLYKEGGKLLYYKGGVFTKSTGIVADLFTRRWVYVEKGVFKKVTGVAKRLTDKKYLYVKKGIFSKATGAAKRISNGKWVYVKKGVFNKRTGVVKKIGKKEWIYVLKGTQTQKISKIVLTKADEKAGLKKHFNEVYAKAVVANVTNKSMTEAQKIKALFQYTVTKFNSTGNPRIPHYHGKDWPVVYAYDMFGPRKGGNCMSYASSFAYLAKAAGCKNVYACNSGGHAWVEVNGRVYDPEQYHDTARKIYNYAYSNPTIKHYWGAISDYKTNPFKRVKMAAF